MYLFFDTETSGLPDYSAGLTDLCQPNILQIAMILANEDGRELMSCKLPIKPEGFTIDEQGAAYNVNKLGNAMLNSCGIQLRQALSMFQIFEKRATLKIAHNYRFDGFLVKSAHAKAQLAQLDPAIEKFCTMKVAQELKKEGKLPSAKLEDFYKLATGKPIGNAHDALIDARAAMECFFWLKKNGLFKPQPRNIPGAMVA